MKQQQACSLFRRLVLSASFLTASLAPLPMYGAEPGMLKGRVVDKSDGEGVIGASVVIPGTNIGTSTDINGNFVLRNVPASAQKVTVSIIGYAPITQTVNVGEGQTATVNFSLGQTTIMASEVVVGAALYKQDRLEVPVTANIVSKEKIKEKPNASLASVIEDVPGVVVTRAGGQTTSNVEIRGSNTFQGGGIATRVQAFYDGFPINAPESGELVLPLVSMNAADRVEVLKGAAATLYGSGAMGGVVNVTGHLADKEEIVAGSNYGFYDKVPSSDNSVYRKGYTPIFWNGYVGYGNKEGKWRYNILYSHNADDGYRANLFVNQNDIKFKTRYDIDATQYIQLTSFYNHSTGGYDYSWPYNTSSGAAIQPGYPDQAYDYTGINRTPIDNKYAYAITLRTNALAGLNYVKLFGDSISLDTKVYYTHNGTRNEFPVYTAVGPYAEPNFNETFSDRVGAGTKLDWKLNDQHRLLAGVDLNVTKVTSSTLFNASTLNTTFHDQQEKIFSSFLQDEWKITNKLTALGSLRYDWSGVNSDAVGSTKFLHPSVDAFSPRVALNYKAMEDMSFRASWGKSFRAPSMCERFIQSAAPFTLIPNPNLDKETMTSLELGAYKQFSDKVSVDVAGFVNDYKDLIESTSVGGFNRTYKNISNARIWGIETNLNVKPIRTINVNMAYTYLHATSDYAFAKNPDPYWLPFRPEHTASASVTWKATKDIAFNTNGRYVGTYRNVADNFNNSTGNNYPGGFVVFNVGAKYQVNKNVSTSFTCSNVFNTQYEEVTWFRAPNRSFVAGIDLSY